MKHKATSTFTPEEKEWMDTVAVNYIIAQSDGFQLGYAQAISDFTANILDYWEGSDDMPQKSVLDTLVDMGVELGKRQQIASKNADVAKEKGYEQYYNWQYKPSKDKPFSNIVNLFTKAPEDESDD